MFTVLLLCGGHANLKVWMLPVDRSAILQFEQVFRVVGTHGLH
jgi:hypothetical protein